MVANLETTVESTETVISMGEDWAEIRDGVRKVCADFPGEYWREKDAASDYPTEFVEALG